MTEEVDEYGFGAPVPLGHPVRAGLTEGTSTGPEIGERLPDFSLPNVDGRAINYHEHRGASKSVVVFFRSAVW